MKRSGRFYRKNEAEVMKRLGLEPTPNSGSGWIVKEDGQNEQVICQLKSTDADSIRVKQEDIRILEHNANVAHKLPLFVIQFLNSGDVWLMARPIEFAEISKYITTGEVKSEGILEDILEALDDKGKTKQKKPIKKIKSSESAREKFHSDRNKKYEKENKSW